MTISYGIPVILFGLSGDTKPTNVPAKSVFIETDLRGIYIFNGTIWQIISSSGDVSGFLQFLAQAEARWADADSSNYVGFKAPSTLSANKIWTLPSADGISGSALVTDGSAVLSFASIGGGLIYKGDQFAINHATFATTYVPLIFGADTVTETNIDERIDFKIKLKSMKIIVSANTLSNNVTFSFRDDGATVTASNLTITAGVTGTYEKTGIDAYVSAGSLCNYISAAGGTGGSYTIDSILLQYQGN